MSNPDADRVVVLASGNPGKLREVQAILAGKALIQLAGVLEEHSVREFRSRRYLFVLQDEIGHTRPAPLGGNVRPLQDEAAVSEGLGVRQFLHSTLSRILAPHLAQELAEDKPVQL